MAERIETAHTRIAFANPREGRSAVTIAAAQALADASLPFTLEERTSVTTIFAPELHRGTFDDVLRSPTLQLFQEATMGGAFDPQSVSDRIYAEGGLMSQHTPAERGRLEAMMWEGVRADRQARLKNLQPHIQRVGDTNEFHDEALPYRMRLEGELRQAEDRVAGLRTHFGHEPMTRDEFVSLVKRQVADLGYKPATHFNAD